MRNVKEMKKYIVALTMLVGFVGSILIHTSSVSAVGIYDTQNTGYFTRTPLALGGTVASGNYSTKVFAAGLSYSAGAGLANKAAYINFILAQLNSASSHNRVGAAYIIQLMRGGNDITPIYDSTAPNRQAIIDDWVTRVNNPAVTLSYSAAKYTDVNSALEIRGGNDNGYDAFREGGAGTRPTLTFSAGGVDLFSIKTDCGNPVGYLGGLTSTSYILDPSITANKTSSEATGTVVVSPAVTNSGDGPSSGTQWQLSDFIVPSGSTIPVAGISTTTPEVYYGYGLTRLDGGTGASFATGTGVLGTPTEPIPDAPAGSHVCYVLSVQARSNTDTSWAHSTPVCLVIASQPKVQILGGDLLVGRTFTGTTTGAKSGNVQTSQTTKNSGTGDATFGSWSEYGILASGNIKGMGSGSAFAIPGLASASVCNYSTLSFDNAGTSTCATNGGSVGGYVTTQTIPDIAGNFQKGYELKDLNINVSNNGGIWIYNGTGNITITGNGKEQSPGRGYVLKAPNATVTITGNITYTTQVLHSITDIPQVIIIAKDIVIDDAAPNIVTNVDAWLVATGSINTCSAALGITNKLTTSICSDPLVVNGPVMAGKLYLNRTGGSGAGANSADAAETFNLRPDAYLWGYGQVNSAVKIEPVYTTALPPRY